MEMRSRIEGWPRSSSVSIRHRARSLSVRLEGIAGPAEDGEREGGGLLVGGGGGASKESPPEASESESETSEEEEE